MVLTYTVFIQNCSSQIFFMESPIKTITICSFNKPFFVVGITVILLFVIIVWTVSSRNKSNSLVKMFILIYLEPKYKNLLDFVWLNRFLYFTVLKWQMSAKRFLSASVYCNCLYIVKPVKPVLSGPL